MTATGVVKKKRVSKKLKSSWRKNVNINDVEDFLEDQRLDERLGSISTVPSNELFKLDTGTQEETKVLTKKEKRQLLLSKPLKCFSALQSYSKVADPITKRNRVRTKEERKNELVKLKERLNREKGILRAKEKQSIEDRKLYEEKKNLKPKRDDFSVDLWEDENKYDIEKDEWANKNTVKHNLRNSGVPKKKVREVVRERQSVLPVIEPPHPGMSYNPSFEDHQNLLQTVAEKELKLIKREEYLDRNTRGMFKKVSETERDKNWLVEMSAGLPVPSNPLKEEEGSDSEYHSVNPPVVNKKKTVKQRRKQKEQLALQLQRSKLKMQKKKIGDIQRLKVLKSQLEKEDKKREVLKEKRIKKKEYKKLEPKVLSNSKFEEPDLEFNMGEDLTGNLRNLKKEGNLLADRFKSLQKRNILESTVRRNPKRAKVKKYTKPGHKDDWKKGVAKAKLT